MSVSRNLVASVFGNTWTALVQIAFVPVYIEILGVEAYGLIGVYAFVQASLAILDLGLTPTLSREVARFGAGAQPADHVRTLLRSIELLFVGGALLVLGLVLVLAPWVAAHWLNVEALPVRTVVHAIELMGILIGARWLAGLYRGAIAGMQRLVWLNAVVASFATVRAAGVVLFLAWVSPTLEAFFAYQCAVTLVEALVLWRRAWGLMPSRNPASFSTDALQRIWRFSGGLALITALYLALTQIDKVMLSTMLSLKSFGYYALAGSVAGALNLLAAPIGQVAYPRLNELVARGDAPGLVHAFHALAQAMTVAIAPAALVLALFAEAILAAWTRDASVSAAAAPLLALLSIGAMLNAFMSTPYMVPLAHGRTRGLVMLNGAFVLIFAPAIYLGVSAYGAVAAGYAWIAINATGILLALPLLHGDLPPAQKWRWLALDVALPSTAALLAAKLVEAVWPATFTGSASIALLLGCAYLAALAAAITASSACRGWLANRWRRATR